MSRIQKAAPFFVALTCLAIPPPILRETLAMTAGTLFEAAPFVLVLGFVRVPWLRPAAALFGCGCGAAAGPAALSLPATALCWASFGPWIALLRFGAALALLASPRASALWNSRAHDAGAPAIGDDPLRQLSAIVLPAAALSLLIAVLHGGAPSTWTPPRSMLAAIAELAAGVAIGAFAPCTTTAVALAAMLRVAAPLTAGTILATAGLVPPLRRPRPNGVRLPGPCYDARPVLAALAIACAALAMRDGSAFVHPRLVPLLWAAAVAALVSIRSAPSTSTRWTAIAPVAMLAALVFGSSAPSGSVAAGTLDDAYPGERIAFTGVATNVNGRTALVRYAITCCRADATAVVVPTDLRVSIANETWISLWGTIVRRRNELLVHVSGWHHAQTPADPFLYR